MNHIREKLEQHQIIIYFSMVIIAALVAFTLPINTSSMEALINPALALMLFVTFLQVPIAELKNAFKQTKFMAALLITNFVVIPILVGLLIQLLPEISMLKLGVLLVLLTPCIDYVVTFSHLGRADARLLLAATPILLLVQMLLLPVYLNIFLNGSIDQYIEAGPFIDAFVWLITVPLALAWAVQLWARRSDTGSKINTGLGLLPVPATALVLFIVVAAMVPQIEGAIDIALKAAPIYIFFSVLAPIAGWLIARVFHLPALAGRAISFSAGTRNSLVIMPLALAIPDAIPVLPAIIVTQTLIELVSELVYIKLIPKLGKSELDI